MNPETEKVIYCEVKKVHNPKPKKVHKINDCIKTHNKHTSGSKRVVKYKNEINNKNKYKKFDFDSISLEEIENDFMAFKAKSEAIKVQNELLRLLLEPSNKNKSTNSNINNSQKKCKINYHNKNNL